MDCVAYYAVRNLLAARPPAANPGAPAISNVALVIRFTRHWIHYGFLGHTFLCVLIAAVEGLLGR